MSAREIERSEWLLLFDSFNRQHKDWLVTVEVVTLGRNVQEIAHGLAFEGISYDLKGSEKDTITINLCETRLSHLRHTVVAPARVRLQMGAEGAHEGMEFLSADGTITRVRFRVAILPEMVDGFVLERP
jgi:Family of unknown function (DUF5335)